MSKGKPNNDQVDVDTKDNQNNLVMMRQITRETRITKEKDNEKDDLGMTGGMKTDENPKFDFIAAIFEPIAAIALSIAPRTLNLMSKLTRS